MEAYSLIVCWQRREAEAEESLPEAHERDMTGLDQQTDAEGDVGGRANDALFVENNGDRGSKKKGGR
jgi:hypothetical protein